MDYWGEPMTGQGNAVALPEHPSGNIPTDFRYASPLVAGYAGYELEKHSSPVQWSETEQGATSDGWWTEPTMDVWPDYSIGGVSASPTELPYSIGPVDPSFVENMELTGRILVPGRDPERAAGPVGATEYRSDLIMQIVQAMGPEVTSEMAAVGLLSGI